MTLSDFIHYSRFNDGIIESVFKKLGIENWYDDRTDKKTTKKAFDFAMSQCNLHDLVRALFSFEWDGYIFHNIGYEMANFFFAKAKEKGAVTQEVYDQWCELSERINNDIESGAYKENEGDLYYRYLQNIDNELICSMIYIEYQFQEDWTTLWNYLCDLIEISGATKEETLKEFSQAFEDYKEVALSKPISH